MVKPTADEVARSSIHRRAAAKQAVEALKVCDCAKLEDIVGCGDDEVEFILSRRLRLMREKPDAGLYVCPECATYWQVDHMQRGPQAIKIVDPFGWENFDASPFRFNFMERFHGGPGQEICMQRGCEQRALKSMAFCVRHAYPELGQ